MLVFCIGENGWDLARKMGIEAGRLVVTKVRTSRNGVGDSEDRIRVKV